MYVSKHEVTHIPSNVLEEYQYRGQAPERGYTDCSSWQNNHKQEVSVEQHPLITQARRGDLIRVMIYVENWYGLQVQDCQMTLLHKNPLSTEEPSLTEETSPAEFHQLI